MSNLRNVGDYVHLFNEHSERDTEEAAGALLHYAFDLASRRHVGLPDALQCAINMIGFLKPGEKFRRRTLLDFSAKEAEAIRAAQETITTYMTCPVLIGHIHLH